MQSREREREKLLPERQHYVLDNLNLIHFLLRKRYGITPAHVDYEDYFQTGCVGLILAAIRFDETKGFQFSTYASQMIWGSIQRYKRDCCPQVKVSRTSWSLYYKAIELHLQGYDTNSIADILSLTQYELNSLMSIGNVDSLNREVVGKDESSTELSEVISDDRDDYMEALEEEHILTCISKVSAQLKGRTRDIWEEFIYSVYYGEKLTQNYFADKYNMSQAQVSRVLNKGKKLFVEYLQQ